MLKRLAARDYALIERAEIDFGTGLIALTGETGAGKSLMVDALLLLAGTRADAGMIRHGAERAEVTAEFGIAADGPLALRLAELEIDDGATLRLRRVLKADGTSRAFANDRAVTLTTLREVAAHLFQIHGQHEHQALLDRGAQLARLDAYAGLGAERAAVAAAARAWREHDAALRTLESRAGRGGEALDYLRFQLDELERYALPPAKIVELETTHRALAHREDTTAAIAGALEALDGDDARTARRLIARAQAELARAAANDSRLGDIASALIELDAPLAEACQALERLRDVDGPDPDALAAAERTLARLHDLARKHRVAPAELVARAEALRAEYAEIADADARRAALEAQRTRARAAYRAAALGLSDARRAAAARLGGAVAGLMGELGMAGGRFEIALSHDADADPQTHGADVVEFMVSANPGQPARPLRKVASGGELSRIGLALEVAALGDAAPETMVFDEVDAGIGGAVAEVLGRKLRELGHQRQVLCVTHLAQVAAQAEHHFAVAKRVDNGATRTGIVELDLNARRDEIARMLGGVEITDKTRALARDMLKRAG